MANLNYSRIASILRRTFAQNPGRISLTTFQKELKPCLNNGESKRLFEYYRDREEILVPITQLHYKWSNIHQDHFNEDAVRDIFLNENIESHFGRRKGVSPKLLPKEEPVAESVETPILPEHVQLLVRPDQLTDTELDEHIAELQATLNAFVVEKNKRAEIVAKKRELFKTVSELIKSEGFTLDEIMQIV